MAESIGPMGLTDLNPGWLRRLPLVGARAPVKIATEGTRPAHPHRPRWVPAGYSSIGLLASIARLRL